MSYGTVVMGDVEYETVIPFEALFDGEKTSFMAEGQNRVTILCQHCKNFRLDPIVLSSVEELVRFGWIKKKET